MLHCECVLAPSQGSSKRRECRDTDGRRFVWLGVVFICRYLSNEKNIEAIFAVLFAKEGKPLGTDNREKLSGEL